MLEDGLWVPRAQRQPRPHQPRRRRECLGELVQIDGCEHAWLEDRGPTCTLLVFVDDATGRLMQLSFVESGSTFTYFGAMRAYLEREHPRRSPGPPQQLDDIVETARDGVVTGVSADLTRARVGLDGEPPWMKQPRGPRLHSAPRAGRCGLVHGCTISPLKQASRIR